MNRPHHLVRAVLVAASFLACTGLHTAPAQEPQKFYYWVTPFPTAEFAQRFESFVIEVNAQQRAQIQAIQAEGPVVFDGRIAAGAAPYNRNYHAAGQPLWNWHFVSINSFHKREGGGSFCTPENAAVCESHPSEIAGNPQKWIADNGDYYSPGDYYIAREIDPTRRDVVANVSNRGMTGAGEKALITGLIIKGGEPRNVVVRALGPSMAAAGVQQPATNPKIEVYRGSSRVATNTDWKSDPRANSLAQSYSALAPTNDKEAAVWLTLMPGTYTLHGLNEDGTEGVVLLEAYDVDSAQ